MRHQKMRIALVVILVVYSFSGCMEQTPPSVVTGRIIAEDGSGVSHAKVMHGQQEAFTDEEGYFSLEGSPEGDKLSVSKEGYIEMIIGVEAVEGQIDVGSIILLETFEDIVGVEELIEYVPDSAAENMIHYYTDLGFSELGTIKVVYTAGTMHITALVTSTQSAFVMENDGALGIVFDFSEKMKEVHMGTIVLTAAFGDEWDVHILVEGETIWSSKDYEVFHETFSGMEEESTLEFIKKLGDIPEDSVHPDLLVEARESGDYMHVGLPVEGYLQQMRLHPEKGNVHLFEREGSALHEKIFVKHPLELQHLEFVSTLVIGLRKAMDLPPINWALKRWAEDLKGFLTLEQGYGKDLQKRLENEKKDWEKRRDDTKNKKEERKKEKDELKNNKEDLEKSKKELEEIKKKYEELKEEFKYYENEVKKIEIEIKKLEEKIRELNNAIEECKKTIDNLDKEINDLEKEINDADKLIKDLEDAIEKVKKRLKNIEDAIKALDDIISDC